MVNMVIIMAVFRMFTIIAMFDLVMGLNFD